MNASQNHKSFALGRLQTKGYFVKAMAKLTTQGTVAVKAHHIENPCMGDLTILTSYMVTL